MRILYISSFYKPAYIYGGPARSVPALCEALAALGASVTVLTTDANRGQPLNVPLERPVDVDGVTVYYYPISRGLPHSFFYSPALARACEGMVRYHDLVVLETFFTHPTGPAVKACRKTNTPYVIPPRGTLLPWALKQKALKKKVYMALVGRRYLDGAVALQCSDLVELEAIENLGFKAPAFLMPNGLATSRWKELPARGVLRRELGIPKSDPVLLMLGRLHHVKNPELALEMLAMLPRRDVHLIYAGPDEEGYQSQLRARASALGCADRIHFTGLLNSSSSLQAMADADLLVMPSLMESFGMAAVEALAAGVPVLLSEHVPVGRWVDEAGAGRQVTCTPGAFVKACDEMLNDESALKETGEQAQALALQRFDISVVAEQMLAQCQAIHSQGKPSLDFHVTEV